MGAPTSPCGRTRSFTVNLSLRSLASRPEVTRQASTGTEFTIPAPRILRKRTGTMPASVQSIQEPSKGIHHNRDFVLQKYLLLQEQHESLSQHLDQLRPHLMSATQSPRGITKTPRSPGTSPSRSSTFSSYESQSQSQCQRWPRQHRRSSTTEPSQLPPQQRRGSLPAFASRGGAALPCSGLETVMDESTLREVAEEEAKLFGVNEGIKRALTELLNCEVVRADRELRTWVQCRLMETEKELRTSRRRRSAPGLEH